MCPYTAFWTPVTGMLTSAILFPFASPTYLLLRKICEKADGKGRAPITFFASGDRHRALLVGSCDSVMFCEQPDLSSTLSCIHEQEGVIAELFYLLLPSNLCCSLPILILISELQNVSKVQVYICFLGNFTNTQTSFTCTHIFSL